MELHRKLGPFEHLLWLVDRWTPRHFILVSRIEGSSISVESLSRALLQCQRRHPLLRTTIQVNNDGTPEFIPSSAPIALRHIPRANDTQWLQEVETELARPFEPGPQPLLRAVLVQAAAVSELILAVHHSIGDGVSAMYLVRDLLKSMEGYELLELPPRPALEDLLRSDDTARNQLQPRAMVSNVASQFDRPQKASFQIFELDPGELDHILSRCRQEGTTLHGALLSALLLTLPGEGPLSCLAPINVRQLLPNVIDDFGLYITSGMATLDRNALPDFWSLARLARKQVMQAFDPRALHAKALAMALVVGNRPKPQAAYERVWRSFGHNAVLTNLGRFPDPPELKRYRVTAVYPILSPELEPVIAVATADQRTCITISSPHELLGRLSKLIDNLRRHANRG
jgi:NRPS condensation-like uncharacterized protein